MHSQNFKYKIHFTAETGVKAFYRDLQDHENPENMQRYRKFQLKAKTGFDGKERK